MSDQPLLEMPGLDRVHHAPFGMPDGDAPDHEWRRAIRRMNAVQLTVDQFDRGLAVYDNTANGRQEPGINAEKEAALVAFCETEGIEPADVAANAILFRRVPIVEALCDGYDVKADNPASYASYVTGPIESWRYMWGDNESTAA